MPEFKIEISPHQLYDTYKWLHNNKAPLHLRNMYNAMIREYLGIPSTMMMPPNTLIANMRRELGRLNAERTAKIATTPLGTQQKKDEWDNLFDIEVEQ